MSVIDAPLHKESSDRFLTYALSVVSGRALPDVRDGLKPVQRRILFAMKDRLHLTPDHSHCKSAAVVGEVLAKFHPHGDTACYDAMVRMAQDFSLRYPLVDGQGNFGSLDGDSAAAYRYTEARLKALAVDVLGEIDEETVHFRDNFSATVKEPSVLPSRVPNLLINGASGIAVGMATSIPPHNLRETVKALLELSADPEITTARLATVIRAPDFPTGCSILNSRKELAEIYTSGRGSIRMRGEWREEDGQRGKRLIIITSIPYAVNKSQLVEKIADCIIEKKLPQLVDVRDESTDEIRIVLELATGAEAEVAMAYLFRNTQLEGSFPVNLTALVPTESGALKPELLSLKACLQHFLDFREEVVSNKLNFERRKLLERIHILEGLVKIFDALDVALAIVRKSEGRSDAAEKLCVRFKIDEIQAFAIVDMRIYQLSRTNIEEIYAELKEKEKRVKEIDAILKSRDKLVAIVRKDLEAMSEKYGDKRRSRLLTDSVEIEFREEDYVIHEDVYAIVTTDSWIKRIRQNNQLETTRLREGDSIFSAHALTTLDAVAFFTNLGSLYVLKVSEFPASGGYGEPLQKTLKFRDGERMVASFPVKVKDSSAESSTAKIDSKGSGQLSLPMVGSALAAKPLTPISSASLNDGSHVVLVTARGVGFVLKVEGVLSVKKNGKRAIKLREGDELVSACLCDPDKSKEVAFFTHEGSGLRVKFKGIPIRDTSAVGIVLMGVRDDDKLAGAVVGSGKKVVVLKLSSDRTKEVTIDDLVGGHRGLKGNKVVSKDQILKVEVKE